LKSILGIQQPLEVLLQENHLKTKTLFTNKLTKPIWYQIGTNLSFYVLIAIIIGVCLGYSIAEALKMEIVGKTFVDIIKLFIIPIIFLTIVLGISSIGDLKKVGRIGIKSLLYFEVVTT
jgi:aerobic C4-dicarboxylate transport protein